MPRTHYAISLLRDSCYHEVQTPPSNQPIGDESITFQGDQDQALYNLIDESKWESALQLLEKTSEVKSGHQGKIILRGPYQYFTTSLLLTILERCQFQPCPSAISLCLRLIDLRGFELVCQKNLHTELLPRLCLGRQLSFDLFHKLIQVGGSELVSRVDTNTGLNALMATCNLQVQRDWTLEVVESLLKAGGDKLVLKANPLNGMTALHYTCIGRQCSSQLAVIDVLLDKGGERLVSITDRNGNTAFHYACEHLSRSSSCVIDVVNRLIALGGKSLVFSKNSEHRTPLHLACMEYGFYALDVVERLIQIGGLELLLMSDIYGCSALHYACSLEESSIGNNQGVTFRFKLVDYLLSVDDGEDLVFKANNNGQTALHLACNQRRTDAEVVHRLIEVGREKLVLTEDLYSDMTALDVECLKGSPCLQVVDRFAEVMGDLCKNPLHYLR